MRLPFARTTTGGDPGDLLASLQMEADDGSAVGLDAHPEDVGALIEVHAMWADLRGQVDDLCDLPAGQIQDHQLAGLLLMDVVEAVAVRQRDVGQTALAIVPDLVRLGRELDARRLGEG